MATPTGRPNGRPPKPTEQHRLNGNPSHKSLPDAPLPGEGLLSAKDIPSPPTLGIDGAELWEQIWTAGRLWLSPNSDAAVIKMLCQTVDEAESMRRALSIGEVPRYYRLPNGSFVTHPYVSQLRELRTQITSWLSSLGFSPADRARLGVGEVREYDPLDELEARRMERLNATR
jgi:P27 family predicted phage terminase small subunit